MNHPATTFGAFDRTNPVSIYEFSRFLIGHSLRDIVGDDIISKARKGKGGLGQMVEEFYFGYDVNSNRAADFTDANLELKCTPLLKSAANNALRIKERLVCTMIDYFDLVKTRFEDSHLIAKCRVMLLLFYLHNPGMAIYDYEFLFRVLWELPEKDLLLIKKDYETIADKVRRGEAHLLSEGDTLYLGACRKGKKGDTPQCQPNSEIRAYKRAFSLKPAYMRYVLNHVLESGKNCYSNYTKAPKPAFELVTAVELEHKSFEDIILSRFNDYIGLDYVEICDKLQIKAYQSKSKYADVSGLIASAGVGKRLSSSDEFIKSGIVMKTIRMSDSGMPRESMSFKNIDYYEIIDNGEWTESELYELFTNRFLFVVFKQVKNKSIVVHNNATDKEEVESRYVLDKVFFWTMPANDLIYAQNYWEHIRTNVLANNIQLDYFWKIGDDKKFHVRPKASKKIQKTPNPHGGYCEKYCYWFNAKYVKQIIENQKNV